MSARDDQAFAAWTKGRRERQEDSFRMVLLDAQAKSSMLLVVADGMGGQAAGDIASETAVEEFISRAKSTASLQPAERLRGALNDANAAIGRRVSADAKLKGMGTTLVAVEIENDKARWISVGDSLLLLVRGGSVSRLNEDHSMAGLHAEMARRGEISKAEAERRGGHHELRSAMMGETLSLIDDKGAQQGTQLRGGDVIIVASDGLLTLDFGKVKDIVKASKHSARGIAEALIGAVEAARAQHQDNATVIAYVHPGKAGGGEGWRLPAFSSAALIAALALGAVIAVFVAASLLLRSFSGDAPSSSLSEQAALHDGLTQL